MTFTTCVIACLSRLLRTLSLGKTSSDSGMFVIDGEHT